MKKQGFLILTVFLMATCCSSKVGSQTEVAASEIVVEEGLKQLYNMSDLNGEWIIFSIEGKEVPTGIETFLQFNIQEKRVHGKAGCNILNFAYETQDGNETAIAFKRGISTRMMCMDMETEDQFLKTCPEIVSFSLNTEKNVATFYDGEKKEVLVLKKE